MKKNSTTKNSTNTNHKSLINEETVFSTMSSMPSFSHGGLATSMGPSPGACLQQRESPTMGGAMSGYCMGRPPSYDLGIGYGSRPSPCSPSQPYQMNGHQYSTNGTSSTGNYDTMKDNVCGFSA